MSYRQYFARYLPKIEEAIEGALQAPDPRVEEHYAMMAYHLGLRDHHLRPAKVNAGKRVRPMLCLLTCEAVGEDPDQALPAAASIELLHNFSLIHDDIEDNSPTRRGRPTVWHLWGIAQAINVGDGLFSLARYLLNELGASHPPQRVLQVQRLFDQTCLRLTEGQYLDMKFESTLDIRPEDYLYMIEGKTAALIEASTSIGALLGGAAPEIQEAYAAFGRYVGLTFQIIDDILGIWGREQETGKSAASDIITKKKTYPVLYGLNHPQIGPTLRELYDGPSLSQEEVRLVVDLLEKAGAREAAYSLAEEYHQDALRALDRTGVKTSAQEALHDFANTLLHRRA